MNHIIPQEFNQSDKLGKFTIPQVMVLGIGGMLFVLILLMSNFWVSLVAFFPIAVVTLIFMYVRVNKVPIYEFVLIYLIYMGSPKLLVFRSDNMRPDDEFEEAIGFLDSEAINKESIESNSKQTNSKQTNSKQVNSKTTNGKKTQNKKTPTKKGVKQNPKQSAKKENIKKNKKTPPAKGVNKSTVSRKKGVK